MERSLEMSKIVVAVVHPTTPCVTRLSRRSRASKFSVFLFKGIQLMIFGLALAADKVAIKMSMPIFLLFYDSNANHKFSTDGSVRGARESEGCAGMPSADSLQRHPDLL